MNLHDYLNVRKVFRIMAAEWDCPVWVAKCVVQYSIDQKWKTAVYDSQLNAHLHKYFPDGKPTVDQYILRLHRARKNGEDVPFLLS